MNQTIKEFIRPTKSTILTTFFVIIVLTAIQTLAIQSWPKETIFTQIYTIIFMPADLIRQTILNLIGANFHSPFTGPITLILNAATYYILGCIAVYILRLYKKRAIKK